MALKLWPMECQNKLRETLQQSNQMAMLFFCGCGNQLAHVLVQAIETG